jgi:hypothetical protein
MSATKVRLRHGPRLPHDDPALLMTSAARTSTVPLALVLLAIVLLLAALPAGASARGGDDGGGEVRVAGTCGKGAAAKLRLRSRDGVLRATFEVHHGRAGASWRVVMVQDRRVVWRGQARTRGGAFEVERGLRDLPGADRVTARAWGPGGVTCAAAATLPG